MTPPLRPLPDLFSVDHRCVQCVLHQHGPGQRPNAPRNRGDVRRPSGRLLKYHVAAQGPVRPAVHCHIHHHGPLLHHVSSDEAGLSGGGDQDVRPAALLFQVLRLGVAVVTVAFSRSISIASGLPTILERPTITQLFPDSSTPYSASRRITLAGVQG